MSIPTLDQQSATPVVPSSTAPSTAERPPSSPRRIVWVRIAGLLIGASAVLAALGLASDTPAATVTGVALGVATSFVLASREMGDKRIAGSDQ
ncbi:hypothetical protein [Raineyella sp. LH-20]|uniref:hypothetical protein n=1 Tax=Raineyella sp. LH-20 TaxID=3081204 RepID=UPI002954C376|nr:hypothetical protein [Raineyella sp. LH-20]WOP19265.1 hypothetical protein R0146_03065 [Raineyella sp. LH-20]